MSKTKSIVEEYQCPGCLCGTNLSCYEKSNGRGLECSKHGTSTRLNGKISELQARCDNLREEISSLRNDLFDLKISTEVGSVNLFKSNLQDIGNGFQVGKFSVTPYLGGIQIKGIIINTSSVDHENAEFSIRILPQTESVTLRAIIAGSCSYFTVNMPNLSPERVRWAAFTYVSSTVKYYLPRG